MTAPLEKDPAIVRVLERLREQLGEAFDTVDHWESDLCAVGIASPRNHGVLVYISTFAEPPDRYHVELELPRVPGNPSPYEPAGILTELDFAQLVVIVREHLRRT